MNTYLHGSYLGFEGEVMKNNLVWEKAVAEGGSMWK
jgi:hypothetical protein